LKLFVKIAKQCNARCKQEGWPRKRLAIALKVQHIAYADANTKLDKGTTLLEDSSGKSPQKNDGPEPVMLRGCMCAFFEKQGHNRPQQLKSMVQGVATLKTSFCNYETEESYISCHLTIDTMKHVRDVVGTKTRQWNQNVGDWNGLAAKCNASW